MPEHEIKNEDSVNPSRKTSFRVAGHRLADWFVPGMIFLFAAVAAFFATTFDKAPDIIVGDAMQPRSFPIFLMGVISILNVVLIFQMLKTPPKERPLLPKQTWVTGMLMLTFYVLTVTVDMFIALAIVLFLLSVCFGERRLHISLLVALITPLAIFLLFDLLLKVRFPRGILTNWYYG